MEEEELGKTFSHISIGIKIDFGSSQKKDSSSLWLEQDRLFAIYIWFTDCLYENQASQARYTLEQDGLTNTPCIKVMQSRYHFSAVPSVSFGSTTHFDYRRSCNLECFWLHSSSCCISHFHLFGRWQPLSVVQEHLFPIKPLPFYKVLTCYWYIRDLLSQAIANCNACAFQHIINMQCSFMPHARQGHGGALIYYQTNKDTCC